MSSVLPLDGNGKKATEESASDDEDEPPVTFYLNAAEVEDQKVTYFLLYICLYKILI